MVAKSYLPRSGPLEAYRLVDSTSEVQGERRAELARAMLSRSLHSPLQLVCVGKGTKK